MVGLGYVGIRLALRAAEAGFNVISIDIDQERVETLAGGISRLLEMPGLVEAQRQFPPMSDVEASEEAHVALD